MAEPATPEALASMMGNTALMLEYATTQGWTEDQTKVWMANMGNATYIHQVGTGAMPPEGGEGGAAAGPPAVVDAPHASQTAAVLHCTMGNWTNEPTAYAYQWRKAGADVATGADYTVTAPDVGAAFDCVVTASNAGGSASSTSNSVTAAAP